MASSSRADVTASIQAGRDWLASAQSPDGAWGKRLDVAATAHALQGLRASGWDVAPDVAALATRTGSDATEAALLLLATADSNRVAGLQGLRNGDGSYGDADGAKLATTGLAVLALGLVGTTDGAAVSWLEARQAEDGAWGAGRTAEDTGLVTFARLVAGVNDATTQEGVAWLLRNQAPDGGWGTPLGTAWALLAVERAGGHEPQVVEGARTLLYDQSSDGGFGRRAVEGSDVSTSGIALWAASEANPTFSGSSRAQQFLLTRRNAPAGWFHESAAVTDTTVVLDVLRLLDGSSSVTALGVLWTLQAAQPNTDFLARRVGSLARYGTRSTVDLNTLLARQRQDGGWGPSPDHGSTVLDTCIALDALEGCDYYDAAVLQRAVQYLTASQHDGAWGLLAADPPEIWSTALAMQALKERRRLFDLADPINDGRLWIEGQQRAGGGWGATESTAWESALAFSAIMGTAFTPSVAQSGLAYLTGSQDVDGSWNQNPFDTALAVQALIDSKPNLRIKDRDISIAEDTEGGVEGDEVNITASVSNTGGFALSDAVVRFFLGDPFAGGTQIGDDETIATLAPGAAEAVATDWNTTGLGGAKNVFVLLDPEDTIDEGSEIDNKAVNNYRVSSKPDLAVGEGSITYTPEHPRFDETISFAILVRNIGETTATNIVVKLYDDEDLIGTSSALTVPANGQQTFHIPHALSMGVHPLTAQVDVNNAAVESNESNNTCTLEVDITPRRDLVLQQLYLSARDPAEGDTVHIWAEVYNANVDEAPNVSVAFYMDGPPGTGTLLGTEEIGTIPGGRTATSPRVHYETQGHPGDHEVYAFVDPDNHVEETDDANNLQVSRFLVSAWPDLVMGNNTISFHLQTQDPDPLPDGPREAGLPESPDTSVVTNVPRGTVVTMKAGISNDGATDATNVLVRFFIGDPRRGGIQIGGDHLVERVRYRTGPASTSSAQPYWWLTSYIVTSLDTTELSNGTYRIYGWIDPELSIAEHDNDNNIGYSEITIGQGPDLTVAANTFVVDDAAPEEADLVSVSVNIKNNTGAPVNQFLVRLFDGNPRAGGTQIDEHEFDFRPRMVDCCPETYVYDLPAINGFEELPPFTFAWDTEGHLGRHQLYLVIDPEDDVHETDEANNGASLSLEVLPDTTPDLEVLRNEITFSPPVPSVGDQVTITATIHNRRHLPANGVRVRFERTDRTLGVVRIGTDQVISQIGDRGSAEVEVVLDTTTLTGSTMISVKADPENTIDERNELNNSASAPMRLRLPDSARALNLQTVVEGTTVFLNWDDPAWEGVAGYDVLRDSKLIQPGREEWARRCTARASSTTTSGNGQGLPELANVAAAASDGNLLTYWQAASRSEDAWLELALPKAVKLAHVTIAWRQAPEVFRIEAFDGREWIAPVTVTGNEDVTTVHDVTQPVETDKLRIVIPQPANGGQPVASIREIRVHALAVVE